MDHTIS